MTLNGNARPLSRVIESQARAIESQNLYGSLLLGQDVEWTELGPDGRPDPWVPSGTRRRNRGVGEAIPAHFTEEQLHEHRARSRGLCSSNEFAICGTSNRQNYVIGKGLAYRAAALPSADAVDPNVIKLVAMAQGVIDAFADACELPALERECMGRLDRDGEYLLRLFPQGNGLLAVRRVEPENVRPPAGWGGDPRYSYGVETAPGDVETPVAYWTVEDPYDNACGPVRVPAEQIVHDRLNVDATAKRGVPTWYAVDGNLRRAEDLLVSMTSMAKVRAKIAAHRKLTGATQATARSMLDALTVATVTDPGAQQTVSYEKMRYGSILTTGGNVEWEFPNAEVEADQFVAVLQAELRAIACRVQMPEWMLTADASNANMASTLVAEAPSTKAFESLQHQFKRRFGEKKVSPGRSLIWRQIDFAVRCGVLPRAVYQYVGVQCEPPSLVVRNRLAEAQTDQIYLDAGVKSIPTIRLQQGLDGAQEDRGFASHPPAAPPAEGPPADPTRQPPVADPGGQRATDGRWRAHESFDPDQPRDEDGKWTSGGGSGGAAAGTPATAAGDQPGDHFASPPKSHEEALSRVRASKAMKQFIADPNNGIRGAEDAFHTAMTREFGGDAKPQVTGPAGVDAAVKAGGIEGFRGLTDPKFTEQFRTGEHFSGRGIYGNGTYIAFSKAGAADEHLPGGQPVPFNPAIGRVGAPVGSRAYAAGVGAMFAGKSGEGGGAAMRLAIQPDARVGDYATIEAGRDEFLKGIDRKIAQKAGMFGGLFAGKAARDELNELRATRKMFEKDDGIGRYALAMGYDAYVHPDVSFAVILNRGKVVVEKDDYFKG